MRKILKNAENEVGENKQAGLTINKKTVIVICLLLVAIMAFAGVLTQVLPRGVYQTADDGTIINDGIRHMILRL